MAFAETLHGLWDWMRKANWAFLSFVSLGTSSILLFLPIGVLRYLRLDAIKEAYGDVIGLIFIGSLLSCVGHFTMFIAQRITGLEMFASMRIKRNLKRLGNGSRKALRTMYQKGHSSFSLPKGSAEIEALSRLGFIHCGRYVERGNVFCELDGLVLEWFDKHREIIDTFPEEEELPF